jgi:DNA-binding MarR family transcriptional regulator
MAAKTATKKPGTTKRGASAGDAEELLNLLTGVFRLLKKRAGGSPKHEELRLAFEQGELGDRHVSPLIALIIGGPASVGELAERIGLTLGTTSLLVGELSRAGLVERREDDRDRRRTIVSISEPVAAVMRPWLRETLKPLGRSLDRMSATQRAHFMDGLRILGEEIGRSAGDGSG